MPTCPGIEHGMSMRTFGMVMAIYLLCAWPVRAYLSVPPSPPVAGASFSVSSSGTLGDATSSAADVECQLALFDAQAKLFTRNSCCAELDTCRMTTVRLKRACEGPPPTMPCDGNKGGGEASDGGKGGGGGGVVTAGMMEEADEADMVLLRKLRARLANAEARATSMERRAKAVERELEDAKAAQVAVRSQLSSEIKRRARTERALEHAQDSIVQLSTSLLEDEDEAGPAQCVSAALGWLQDSCFWCSVAALLILVKAVKLAKKRHGWCFTSVVETSFDAMIPSVKPLLVVDPNDGAHLFACVPLRNLPPRGRGAPLSRDGENGDFMRRALQRARCELRKLVVIAYAAVSTPPTLPLLESSYERLCLEATSKLQSSDIVLVWHDMIHTDGDATRSVVAKARWRSLFLTPRQRPSSTSSLPSVASVDIDSPVLPAAAAGVAAAPPVIVNARASPVGSEQGHIVISGGGGRVSPPGQEPPAANPGRVFDKPGTSMS